MTNPMPVTGVVRLRGGRGLMGGGTGVYALVRPVGVACAAGSGTGAKGVATAHLSGGAKAGVPVPPHNQEINIATRWPLRSFLELGAYPGAVPCARLHVKAMLWEWGLSIAENVELVTSEIVTNSVQASRLLDQPSVVRLWLLSDKERVLILVWDASPHPPTASADSGDDPRESGRGLMLVEAISDQWSWYFTRETTGKVVWALCSEAR